MIAGKSVQLRHAFSRVRHGNIWRNSVPMESPGVCGPRGAAAADKYYLRQGVAIAKYAFLQRGRMRETQGVPDLYVIHVPLNQALFGFGDAVCVPAIEWIIRAYAHALIQKRRCDKSLLRTV